MARSLNRSGFESRRAIDFVAAGLLHANRIRSPKHLPSEILNLATFCTDSFAFSLVPRCIHVVKSSRIVSIGAPRFLTFAFVTFVSEHLPRSFVISFYVFSLPPFRSCVIIVSFASNELVFARGVSQRLLNFFDSSRVRSRHWLGIIFHS